ncbi:hypothetical protein N7468_003867 [Penicillium chermesinum]|uniref:Uncharacterized protein n=1 Tax=Penicillium chermesinum TaxID=63820 RepID=A0A9W9P9T5_9EURO|nr:uncharacterized protein N7468_003867 [Penicillium chermesinum]KAJ5239248.1 hypothetical protein N7468_003867 [Penicillium chermesinum]
MAGTFSSTDNTTMGSIPWAEVFSRHEFLLSSHLEMLGAVKNQLPHDGEASRTVASMVSKTIQSMNQFKIVRKQMMHNRRHPCFKAQSQHNSSPKSSSAIPSSAIPSSTKTPRIHPTLHLPETEDISQEVQRRLRIQEERRRKKESGRSDKRKRESMGSNENASPGTAHQRKRKKVGKDSVSLKKESASSSQRKRYLDGPSSLDAAKTKKSKNPRD